MTHPPARVHQLNQRMPTIAWGLIVSVWDYPRPDGSNPGAPRDNPIDHQDSQCSDRQEVETQRLAARVIDRFQSKSAPQPPHGRHSGLADPHQFSCPGNDQEARRSLSQTVITPTARHPVASTPAKKNSSPGPTGLGLGSGQRPILAARMMTMSGADP